MSTRFRVRRAPWFAFATTILLLGLPPSPLRAQEGIVIPLPLPSAEYASLPSNDRVSDPAATGSLPSTSRLGARSLSGFHNHIAKGTIALRETTPTSCLPGDLRQVIADVAARFGPVSIQSTHRSTSRNRRVGGARHSLHLSCRAVDFRIRTQTRSVMAYLHSRPEVGGLKIYRNGIIHIDNGSRRSW